MACCALAMTAFWYERRLAQRRTRPWQAWAYILICLASLGFLGESLRRNARETMADSLSLTRNFYGILRVAVYNSKNPDLMNYTLQHGRISHGCQFTAVNRRRQATTYYGDRSGVGLALLNMPRRSGLRVGISDSEAEEEIDETTWMLMTRTSAFLSIEDILEATSTENKEARRRILWTDDFSNLFQILQ
ncbi:MAG: hypothetical protein P1P89_10965 [Desulfobacterales bacterium]|nr:hypothetical protein [Desulfobacterales bacterium]